MRELFILGVDTAEEVPKWLEIESLLVLLLKMNNVKEN